MGLAICYDLRFPELFRDLALRGADAVVVPSAWYAGPLKEEHWLTLLQARAIENTMYVGGANLCGPPFAARSAVFDPFGVMLAGAGEGEALVSAQLNRGRIDEVRTKLPSLTHVRRDLFRS
jgi:predicted amidohydrolase